MSSSDDAVARMERLGRSGLLVSIACGPVGVAGPGWTAVVMTRDGQTFDRPFRAQSFEQAVAIAEGEATKRGWLPESTT